MASCENTLNTLRYANRYEIWLFLNLKGIEQYMIWFTVLQGKSYYIILSIFKKFFAIEMIFKIILSHPKNKNN